jgi:hypothetical protein
MAEFQRHALGATISQVLKRFEHRHVKPLLRATLMGSIPACFHHARSSPAR